MQNDPGAPIDPIPEQKLALEDRRDATARREELETALEKRGSKEISRARRGTTRGSQAASLTPSSWLRAGRDYLPRLGI